MDLLRSIPPGLILVVGALLLPLFRRSPAVLRALLVALPAASYAHLLSLPAGEWAPWAVFGGLQLVPVRIDPLAMVWGHVFHIAALLSAVYSLHVRDPWRHVAGLSYAGSAIGAVFAGDLLTLFVYWELTAVTSVFLIWGRDELDDGVADMWTRGERFRSGMRYLVIQVLSGVVLLAGILWRLADHQGSGEGGNPLYFGHLFSGSILDAPVATQLIFLAFGIKAAFPLLHSWLQDAYPKGTVTGTVFLSAFTTKMAIYTLARGFAGTEVLVTLGVVMTLFPVFFAVIENDLRRVLAYSLNNQLGFMCVGVGIGTELALNGTAGHAFAHILYKALLFMSMGAVLYRTGTTRATELGGLARTMPWTATFCIVGSISISAFPFTSGFVTKSMVLSAAGEGHMTWVFLALMFASAGVLEHSGIKIPFFAFFAHDSGKRPKEAPRHMLVAMGAAAAACLLIGCAPSLLYGLLPFPVDYHPYSASHVADQMMLLSFAALAFVVLWRTGRYPAEERATVLDADWLYRRAAPGLLRMTWGVVGGAWGRLLGLGVWVVRSTQATVYFWAGPRGFFGRTWTVGNMALWSIVLLGVYLLLVLLWG
ncbi:MAG: Na(+)/H(+) antiporter subunit D [Acidobacteriota bacterium]